MAITYEQVAKIMDEESTAGRKPTQNRVRELLGNTGSLTTIGRFMRQWRESQTTPAAKDLPDEEVFALTSEQTTSLARVLRSIAQAHIEQERKHSDEVTRIAREETDSALASAEEAQKATDALNSRIQTLEAQLEELNAQLIKSTAQIEFLQAERAKDQADFEARLAKAEEALKAATEAARNAEIQAAADKREAQTVRELANIQGKAPSQAPSTKRSKGKATQATIDDVVTDTPSLIQ